MAFLTRSLRTKFLVLFALVPMIILSACGGSTTSPSGTTTPAKVPITVGSKLDPEAQLLGEMYVLLLRKAGFTVTPKLALGMTPIVFAALKSGAIDLYPEFTGTGLNILSVKSAYDPTKDYATVKSGFEQQYHITWLDQAPLNDGYALCTSTAESQKLGATTLSQLAPKVSQLTLATQSDGVAFFDALKATYGFGTSSFKAVKKVDYAIVHPAPIVRDSVLQSDPGIATALNPLAPDLTTDVSIMLQGQVATKHAAGESIGQAVKEVATAFLQSKGLL